MADVPVLNAAADAGAAPKKSMTGLILGIAAFVVLAGGGAAAFMFMGHGDTHGKTEASAKEPLLPPLYVALDPPFVVNFEGDQLVRFLQVTVQVMTRDPATVELLKANDPVVRNDLLLLFANQKYEVVARARGQGEAPCGCPHCDPPCRRCGRRPACSHRKCLFHKLRDAVNRERRQDTRSS